MSATFHLEDLGGDLASAIPELVVGPWRHAPGLVAFDAGADRSTSLWRVGLARDDAASQRALAGGERSVAETHTLLDDLPDRLDRAIAALTGGAAPLALDQLAWSTGPAAAPAEHDPGRLAQLLDRVADLARGRARIETRVEGALVAQSITTLSGDTELWTAPRLSLSGARLHARSVAVAVRTRHAWARILTLTVRGAGRLALLGLPGGVVSAVPLVWRFVRDVLRELRGRDAALRDAG